MKLLPYAAATVLLLAARVEAQETPGVPAAPAEVIPPKPIPVAKPAVEVSPPTTPFSPGSVAPAPPVPVAAPLDAVTEAELQQILSFLNERYVRPAALAEPERHRATVQGLLARLGPGAELLLAAAPVPDASLFRSEVLEARVGYMRLGTLGTSALAGLDAALRGFVEKHLEAVILDLRATPRSGDFALAAETVRRFAERGKLLFTLRGSAEREEPFTATGEPLYRGKLVVLTSSETAGAVEVIAATLRAQAGGMIIGQKTRGEAAEFAELPLPSGPVLRVAVAEASLPEGGPIFPGGVVPDLPIVVPAETTAAVLAQSAAGGISPLVYETERPRMNEAALMAGTNPELDALQIQQQMRGEKPKSPLRDAVLQRAMDFLTTVSIYEKGQRAKK